MNVTFNPIMKKTQRVIIHRFRRFTQILICDGIGVLLICGLCSAQTVSDVSDPAAIVIKDAEGKTYTAALPDLWANYPALRPEVVTALTKKIESTDEVAAQKLVNFISAVKVTLQPWREENRAPKPTDKPIAGQKIDLPKPALDKHNARIAKFAKAKEDALLAAVKKSQVAVKLETTVSQDQIDAQFKALTDARALAQKAKAKKDELLAAGIPISADTQKAVEAAQPKPTPPPPQPSPTPGDGL